MLAQVVQANLKLIILYYQLRLSYHGTMEADVI